MARPGITMSVCQSPSYQDVLCPSWSARHALVWTDNLQRTFIHSWCCCHV